MNKIIMIKLIAMAYVIFFHFTISVFMSKLIDKIIPNVTRDKNNMVNESKFKTVSLMYFNMLLIVYAMYLFRNLIEHIPFPLDGMYGYQHSRLKERTSVVLTSFFIMFYQKSLRERVDIVLNNYKLFG